MRGVQPRFMKKALKLLAVTALATVIGLSMAGCPPLPDDGEDGSLGNTMTITDAQVYMLDGNKAGSQYTGTVEGLNYVLSAILIPSLTDGINGTPSVTLTNGKLNVTLGMPKDSVLSSLDSAMGQMQGVIVSPSGAKFFQLSGFSPSASWNGTTVQQRRADGFIMYLYCDKDVNVTGKVSTTNEDGQPSTYDVAMNLKAGWNSVITTSTGSVGSQKTGTLTADDKWVVSNPPNNGNNGGDGSLGNTLTIKDAQVYMWDGDKPGSQYNGTVEGLYIGSTLPTDVIDGTPSVTLTNGKLNVTLGMPKDSALSNLETILGSIPEGVTVSPSGAKFFMFMGFTNSAEWNGGTTVTQVYQGSGNRWVTYWYCDKDVNITGKNSGTNNGQPLTSDYAMYLKSGWNSVIQTVTGTGQSIKNGTPTADDKWVVINPN